MSPGINGGSRGGGNPKSNGKNDRNRKRSVVNQQIVNNSHSHGHAQHPNNLSLSEQNPAGSTKNSNTQRTPSTSSHQDIPDIEAVWPRMVPPNSSQTQSPSHYEASKPTNVDRRMNAEVEQREKLNKLMEDLRTGEEKLIEFLNQYDPDCGMSDESDESGREDLDDNNDVNREIQLQKRIDEAETALTQLQDYQDNLDRMQQRIRERFNKAHEAQQAFFRAENRKLLSSSECTDNGYFAAAIAGTLDTSKITLAELRLKMAELMHKKNQLQMFGGLHTDMFSGANCSCNDAQHRNKAQLEAIWAELSYIKRLIDEIGQNRESDSEQPDMDTYAGTAEDVEPNEENISDNLLDRQKESTEMNQDKTAANDIKEQTAPLQADCTESNRLKQSPPLSGPSMEKKQSNKLEQGQSSITKRGNGKTDAHNQNASTSQMNYPSTSNIWPPPMSGANAYNAEMYSSENLVGTGPQAGIIQDADHQDSTEYYRRLLLSCQAQELQMMGVSIQQCCQLLWNQQQDLQFMRNSLTLLQLQLRHAQGPPRMNNIVTQEEYLNSNRNTYYGDSSDATLPPSSSMPNLVSFPHLISHNPGMNVANPQQYQLNNQVPPGNRANNYWDNFRSYSRQNLLYNRENITTRNNISNDASYIANNGEELANGRPMRRVSSDIKEVLKSLLLLNKRRPEYLLIVLRKIKVIIEDDKTRPRLIRTLRCLQMSEGSVCECCYRSSDEEAEGGVRNLNTANQPRPGVSSSPVAQVTSTNVNTNNTPSTSTHTPGCNEDLAEADQSRPDSSGNQQNSINEACNEDLQTVESHSVAGRNSPEIEIDLEGLAAKAEDERAEDSHE